MILSYKITKVNFFLIKKVDFLELKSYNKRKKECYGLETEKYNKKTNKTPNETEKNLEVERKKYFKLMIDKIKYGFFLSEGTLSLKNDFSYGTNKVALKLKEIYKISDKLQKNIDFWNKKLAIEKNIKNGY